jgi:hypothetical protein
MNEHSFELKQIKVTFNLIKFNKLWVKSVNQVEMCIYGSVSIYIWYGDGDMGINKILFLSQLNTKEQLNLLRICLFARLSEQFNENKYFKMFLSTHQRPVFFFNFSSSSKLICYNFW